MSALIRTENLKKYFDSPTGKLHAVDGINIEINKGEILGVVGESGCGKSTLGRVLIHLLESTDGKIFFEDKDITNLSKDELHTVRNNMQMIFQDPYSSVNPRMTVSEIIAEPLKISKKFTKREIADKVAYLMDMIGLAKRLRLSYPHELDGGRRQRISVARAIALEPKFIVCDEPVSALDVSIQAQILNLLQELQEKLGLTYMFITHDLSVVKYISHNILVMYLGQEVEKADANTLFDRPLHPYTKALLSAVPIIDMHQKRNRILLKGELTSPIDPKPGCRFAARCNDAKERCFQEPPLFHEVEPEHFVACHLFSNGAAN